MKLYTSREEKLRLDIEQLAHINASLFLMLSVSLEMRKAVFRLMREFNIFI